MAKKSKKASNINLYYINGQAQKNSKNNIKLKEKERQKRIKQNKAKQQTAFDAETEEVIKMTNKNKIKKEKEQKIKVKQQEEKKKLRIKRIKFTLKIVLLLAIIAGGIVFALVSPIFNIKNIEVLNNEKVSSETIISLSELKTDENIFRFLSFNLIKNIKANAYIEDVKIHRKLPNTVQIEVKERKHKFSVDFLGQYAYINNQGYILETSEETEQKPIILGIVTNEQDITVGNRLCNEDLEKLEDVIKIMDALKEYNLDAKVTSIEISNKNNYTIYMEEENKKIYLGDNTNLSNKILYVNAIIEQEKGKKGEIFANGDLNNKFRVYFRENVDV